MGTTVRINVFGTLSVTSANVNKKIARPFFKHDEIYNYYYIFVSKIITVSHFRTFHEFKSPLRFRNKYGFEAGPFENLSTIQVKTHFHYYWMSRFFNMIKLVLFVLFLKSESHVKNQI